MSRIGREMICLMEGRHVHPSTIYPGGVGTVATPTLLTDYQIRLIRCLDFIKKAVAMNDDVFDFFYEALPGYEEVGRRRILLELLGRVQQPRLRRLLLQEHGRLGQRDVRHPGHRRRRRAGDHEPRRDQPRHPDPARLLLLPGLDRGGDVRPEGPARQPGGPAPPVEPDDDPEAAEARPRRRQLLVGDEPALVRQAHGRQPRDGHRRRRARAAVGDGAGQQGPHPVRQRDRPQREDDAAQDAGHARGATSSGRSRSGRTRSSATARGSTSSPTRRAGVPLPRQGVRGGPRRAARRRSRTSTSRTTRSAAASTRPCAACSSHHMVIRDGKIANYHPYPPTPWNGSPTDSYGTPGPYEDACNGHADLRGGRRGQLPRHRHHARGPVVRPVPAVRRAHVPGQRASTIKQVHSPMFGEHG